MQPRAITRGRKTDPDRFRFCDDRVWLLLQGISYARLVAFYRERQPHISFAENHHSYLRGSSMKSSDLFS